MLHHTADQTGEAFVLEGKPGPKIYQAYRKRRATTAMKKVLVAYETRARNVIALEKKAMRQMEAYHRSKGWACIGYHRVHFPSGHVYEGRPLGYLGAHTMGANDRVGYSFMGNFEVNKPTTQALGSFQKQMKLDGVTTFVGHFQLNPTACPGKHLIDYFNLRG